MIRFDLSSIPAGATITSAVISTRLSNAPSTSRTYDMFRVTSSWTEAAVTWANQPTLAGAPTFTRATGTVNGFITWTVTSDVASFVSGAQANNGWLIRDIVESFTTNSETVFNSREASGTANDPYITVTYMP